MREETLADLLRQVGITPARAAFENERPQGVHASQKEWLEADAIAQLARTTFAAAMGQRRSLNSPRTA